MHGEDLVHKGPLLKFLMVKKGGFEREAKKRRLRKRLKYLRFLVGEQKWGKEVRLHSKGERAPYILLQTIKRQTHILACCPSIIKRRL